MTCLGYILTVLLLLVQRTIYIFSKMRAYTQVYVRTQHFFETYKCQMSVASFQEGVLFTKRIICNEKKNTFVIFK